MAHSYISTPIYNYLKEALLSGEYSPGEQITEAKIADMFKSSRTPVRDAFRKLSEDGLLTINPNKSVEAAYYDEKALTQMGIVRLQLDLLSAKLALHYGSNSDFLKMKELAIQCCDAAESGDHVKAVSFDVDFHTTLAKTSQNEFIYDMQCAIWLRTRYTLAQEKKSAIGYGERVKLHLDIVDSLFDRDEETTLIRIKNHILARYSLTDDLPPNFIENM